MGSPPQQALMAQEMTEITTKVKLDRAINSPAAVLLIWVSWSGQSRFADRIFIELQHDLAIAGPIHGIEFYLIDVSAPDQVELTVEFERWLDGSSLTRDEVCVIAGGYGSFLWLSGGRVVEACLKPHESGRQALLDTTARVLGLDRSRRI